MKNMNPNKVKLNSLFYLTVCLFSGVLFTSLSSINHQKAEAATLTLQAGVMDDFDTSNGQELPFPSPGSQENLRSSLPSVFNCTTNSPQPRCNIKEFDDPIKDRNLRHTFTFDDFTHPIHSAHLEMQVKAIGNAENDVISLFFAQSPSGSLIPPRWNVRIGTLLGTTWEDNRQDIIKLDLSNLPLFSPPGSDNFIPSLNTQRFLDIEVQDDTEVDYIKLTLGGKKVPEPSSLLGLTFLLILAIKVKLKAA